MNIVHTGVIASKEDTEKIFRLYRMGWQQGEVCIVFSVGEGIRKDQATRDARIVLHRLALDYGLPEIQGYYGITKEGEFIKT